MKRISKYKKLFNVEGPLELASLKKTYRDLVKEWHPDKFQSDDEKATEAEEMSRKITQGYHFLVSIAPETMAKGKEEYDAFIVKSTIDTYEHEKNTLTIIFNDGTTYEYFAVNKQLFGKFNNSPTPLRFAKRNIFNTCIYRKTKKDMKKD